MLIGGELGYRVLQRFPIPCTWQTPLTQASPPSASKLESYWGTRIWSELRGRTVLDFGCGTGGDSIEIAKHGAAHVVGVDIVPQALAVAAQAAERAHVADRCVFQTTATEKTDAIISIDCFEHFADPAAVLHTMAELLNPQGCAYISFGPPWFHPYGGHSFSVFPWAHLIFTERALLRWRSRHCGDGATRFHEVRGGLNQMTVRRFECLVRESPLEMTEFTAIPIRAVRRLHNRLTREFFTSMVRCKLRRKRPCARR
jgi:SAM-dependent methyltransferase